MTVPTKRRSERVSLRMTPTAKLTLDSAAAASNKRLPDFLLDAALDAAFDTLLDRRVFHLDDKHWDALLVALAVPPRNNPGLRKLLSRKPAWGQ